ncbi:hypothetical protein EBS57_05560, partial [bacterium]|nr:hypothetical protein [bacterium]
MVRLFLLLLCLGFSLIQADAATWWQEHTDPLTWTAERETLKFSLQKEFSKKKPGDVKADSIEAANFRVWQWLEYARPDFSQEEVAAFRSLGENSQLLRPFLENLRPEDDAIEAVRILLRIQLEHPECIQVLPCLAVAIALVFDQPFPKGWPHHQVAHELVPLERVDPVRRMQQMTELQVARRYLSDLRDFTVSEMKFIVDHPLVDTEMEWARKNVTASRSGFSKVFSSIRYDIRRYESNQLVWPYGPYLFSEIKSRGGICVDQAYFAAMTGKAKGLPTLYFSGQGEDGGHAWFGYMDSPGRWETDCGRYESQNYPVGNAVDPQTWRPISDTELLFLAKSRERSPGYQQAKLFTDLARTLVREDANRWLDAALEVQPEFLPAWYLQAELLNEREASPEAKKDFWVRFTKRFANFADLRVQGQEKLLEFAKARGDDAEVKDLSRQILVQNRTRRFDLGIGSVAAEVGEKIEAGKWGEAETAFRKALRELKGQAGGNLYYGLVEPFVEAALA